MKESRLRIAVGGLAVTFPFGGMFWHYLQFVLGLQKLGHDVFYIEDVGRWCYDTEANTYVYEGGNNARIFDAHVRKLDAGLEDCWAFRDATGETFGASWPEAQAFCESADIFLNLSLSHNVLDIYGNAACTVLVDTDPLYTQALIPRLDTSEMDEEDVQARAVLDAHDAHFTFGQNVGRPGCTVPTGGYDWQPILQPVALDQFADARKDVAERRKTFTTIASWEPNEALTRIGDVLYGGKSTEFSQVLDLPKRTSVPLELALSGKPPIVRLEERDWIVRDALPVSDDPWRIQEYMADSLGEFTVAKHAYVVTQSGWFSDRSACYLALGVPVVLQDTGFKETLPVGEGLLTFTNKAEAVAAIESIAAEPERHAARALEIAEEYLRAEKVMQQLLDAVTAHA